MSVSITTWSWSLTVSIWTQLTLNTASVSYWSDYWLCVCVCLCVCAQWGSAGGRVLCETHPAWTRRHEQQGDGFHGDRSVPPSSVAVVTKCCWWHHRQLFSLSVMSSFCIIMITSIDSQRSPAVLSPAVAMETKGACYFFKWFWGCSRLLATVFPVLKCTLYYCMTWFCGSKVLNSISVGISAAAG